MHQITLGPGRLGLFRPMVKLSLILKNYSNIRGCCGFLFPIEKTPTVRLISVLARRDKTADELSLETNKEIEKIR